MSLEAGHGDVRRFRRSVYLSVVLGNRVFGTFALLAGGLASIWYIVEGTGSGFWLGILATVRIVPAFFGSFVAGPMMSWMGSRALIIYARAITVVALGIGVALLHADLLTPPLVAAIIFAASIAVGPAGVADTARFPEFVRLARLDLARFNAQNRAAVSATGFVAMLLIGWLIDQGGILLPLTLGLVASALNVIALAIWFPRDNQAFRQRAKRHAGTAQLAQASSLLMRRANLAPFLVAGLALTALAVAVREVIVPLIVEGSGSGATALSMIFVASELAATAGAAAYARVAPWLPRIPTVAGCFSILAVCALVLAAKPLLLTCAALALITGSMRGLLVPLTETTMQANSPPGLRGDILGVAASLGRLLGLPAVLLVGALESWVGLSVVLLMVAAACAATAITVASLSRGLHHTARPADNEPGEGPHKS